MTGLLPRRRVLSVLGAALALPAGAALLRGAAPAPVPVSWHGEVLGAVAGMTLWHPDPDLARRTIGWLTDEIARLDAVFSLNRRDSEISRLNASGRLERPSRDLLDVLDFARIVSEASGGAFDPTIQPLWRLYAGHFARVGADPAGPPAREVAAARSAVDHTRIGAARAAASLAPGMAISLNGIAQGYVTDRISDLLRNEGFDRALVQLGETRAVGAAPGGEPFRIALLDPLAPERIGREVALADAALAVSGGYGLRFGPGLHHIFDPATGLSANRVLDVAVTAPRATLADALSTAIHVAGPEAGRRLLAAFPHVSAEVTRPDQTVTQL